jgi:hypothetical protein
MHGGMREQRHTTKTRDMFGGKNDRYIEGQKLSEDTAAGSALPTDLISERLELFYFPDKVRKFLRRDPDFRRLEIRCHQIAYVKDIAESRYNISVVINALIRTFDCPPISYLPAISYATGMHLSIIHTMNEEWIFSMRNVKENKEDDVKSNCLLEILSKK